MTQASVLETDQGTVCHPQWIHCASLIHGTTTRRVLPQPGKASLCAAVERSRRANALPWLPVVGGEQVHGSRTALVDRPPDRIQQVNYTFDRQYACGEFGTTDALIVTHPGVLIAIQTADCLPLLLLDHGRRMAGQAHCGWRGLRQGLAGELARQMQRHGADVARLQAWIGPCIRAEHYEVGPQLVDDFAQAFPGAAVSPNGTYLDLAAVARHQLLRAGLREEQIADSLECTFRSSDRYHSYRKAGAQAGRLLSFIGFRE